MKTAAEIFGAEWRNVDVTWLSSPDKRREHANGGHAEKLTFGVACNALINSLRRTDAIDRRHYSKGRETYAPLRAGMFTLADMLRVFQEWRVGARYVYGLGPACKVLLETFFELAPQDYPQDDVLQIFAAILDAAQVAARLPSTHRVGMPTGAVLGQYLQNIEALARAGYEIATAARCDRGVGR